MRLEGHGIRPSIIARFMPYRIVTTAIMASHRQLSEASSRSAFPHGMEVQVYKRDSRDFTHKKRNCKAVRCFEKVVIAACLLNNITSPPDCVEGATEEIEKSPPASCAKRFGCRRSVQQRS